MELDPYLVRLARGLLPAAADLSRDPRVQIIYQDARRFLETTDQRYDVILMALPGTKNAQLNRFYTEILPARGPKLLPGGVFSFGLTGAETSLSPLRAAYLAMAYHTLGQVFPEVAAFPGGQVRFFASTGRGVLVSDPEVLVQRLKNRQLPLQYVREYYLLQDLSPWRWQYSTRSWRQPAPSVNTDLNPRCYFFDLVLSTVQEGLGVKEALLAVQKLPPAVPWAALALATGLAGVALRRRPGPSCLYQVGVMGLGTMAMEILGLVLYQIRLGSLYQQLGLLIAAFMAGMAACSAAVSHWPGWARGGPRLWRGCRGPGGPGRIPGPLVARGCLARASGSEFWTWAGYVLMLAAAGFGGGGIFAASAAIWHEIRACGPGPGRQAVCCRPLGATLGTLGVSLLVLPVWGIVVALWMVAFLHAGAGVMAL